MLPLAILVGASEDQIGACCLDECVATRDVAPLVFSDAGYGTNRAQNAVVRLLVEEIFGLPTELIGGHNFSDLAQGLSHVVVDAWYGHRIGPIRGVEDDITHVGSLGYSVTENLFITGAYLNLHQSMSWQAASWWHLRFESTPSELDREILVGPQGWSSVKWLSTSASALFPGFTVKHADNWTHHKQMVAERSTATDRPPGFIFYWDGTYEIHHNATACIYRTRKHDGRYNFFVTEVSGSVYLGIYRG